MFVDVTYEPDAQKGLKLLPKADRVRMLNALDQVGAEHPKRLSFVTEIKGAEGMWRARMGDYRAIYRITDAAIEVIAIGHRRDIYE